jgi:hypothetical protein
MSCLMWPGCVSVHFSRSGCPRARGEWLGKDAGGTAWLAPLAPLREMCVVFLWSGTKLVGDLLRVRGPERKDNQELARGNSKLRHPEEGTPYQTAAIRRGSADCAEGRRLRWGRPIRNSDHWVQRQRPSQVRVGDGPLILGGGQFAVRRRETSVASMYD